MSAALTCPPSGLPHADTHHPAGVMRRRPRAPIVEVMTRYPNIGDHGLIGDLQTAALVTTDGTVDWFCCPRFGSPSVFASLLNAEHGGHCRITPDRDDYVTRQLVTLTPSATGDGQRLPDR